MFTKQEAHALMKEGVKMQHRYFSDKEWITYDNGEVLFDDVSRCSIRDFWSLRETAEWSIGWDLYDKTKLK